MSQYKDDDVIAKIIWCIADLRDALTQRNIKDTDENIAKILDSRFKKTLEESSVEHGWDVIDTLVTMCEFEEDAE
jgi:hypothetical protein